ncbi:MAG: glycine--tRNA ligase subunit beta [Candidatus Cloacimonetes bacterium 4572_65]|nr:MAG: glycine--tRNA ligase subunit beta [Candidatus Cloacimonetes bacterium 4572_65]
MNNKDFLFELGVEEIPAGYIANAEKYIVKRFKSELKSSKIEYSALESYTTPKRFSIYIKDLQLEQADEVIEKMGPAKRIAIAEDGSLSRAGAGFLRGAGCTEKDMFIKTTPKGEYIAYRKEVKGSTTQSIITGFLADLISNIPFPKSMRWGTGKISFARPIRGIILLMGSDVIPFEYNNIVSGREAIGNRYIAFDVSKEVAEPAQYLEVLESISITANRKVRLDRIKRQVEALYINSSKKIVEDARLLETVTDLVEYPTAIIGNFEEKYLALPDKIITSTISQNQKYFSVMEESGLLANEFCFISNGNPKYSDIIRKGNEKVIKARLEDAEFFFQEDRKKKFEEYVENLKDVTFQADLGSIYEKTERCSTVANYMIKELGLEDGEDILRTVKLAKADLVTLMLGEKEFTKLQGYMGSKYAKLSGEKESVCTGIYEHYMPRGQNDGLPTSVTGAVAAIVDKLDTVCGIIGVGLIPTGSNDPFGLRRAANGIVKILDNRDWDIDIFNLIEFSFVQLESKLSEPNHNMAIVKKFFKQRIKWLLEEYKIAYDVIDSVLDFDFNSIGEIKKRAFAIQQFKGKDEFEQLVLGYKRVSNIISKAKSFSAISEDILEDSNELNLYNYFKENEGSIESLLNEQSYEEAMHILVEARSVIDSFFDNVMVNAKDIDVKNNRYSLLNFVKNTFMKISDLDKIVVN